MTSKTLFGETQFLLSEPDEYSPSLESEASFISAFKKSDNSALFLAFDERTKLMRLWVKSLGAKLIERHTRQIFYSNT
jgi:hypothetical protein